MGVGRSTLWDSTTGQQRMPLQQREGATIGAFAVAFSNDGKMVAAGNNQGALRLWNVESGQLKMSFKGHTDAIRSVAFSPDSKTLLSGSTDKTARLWDVVTGQELLSLKGHTFPVHLVAFAPDGKRLATASHNVVKLWLAATEPEATAFRFELDPDDPDGPRAANIWGDRLLEIDRPREAEHAYHKALDRLEKLAAALPDTPDYQDELAYCLLASSLITDSPPAKAQSQRQFAEIWRTLPADRQLQLRGRVPSWGNQLRDAGRFQEALRVQEQLTEMLPGSPWVWFQLAYTHEKSGQPEKAIAAYSRAIQVDPKHAPSWNNRGVNYYKLRQLDKAITDFRQAIAVDPTNTAAHDNLGSALRAQGKPDDAIAAYRQALEALGPDHPKALKFQSLLANAYESRGNRPEAIRLYEQVRDQRLEKLGPKHADTLSSMNTLAMAYWRDKQLDRAIALLEEIVRLNRADRPPDDPETYTSIASLGVHYRDGGRLREATALLEEVVEWARKQPAPVPSRFAWVTGALAETYEQDQQFARAEPLHREALERAQQQFGAADPCKAGPLASLGFNLLQQKKYADAEPLVRECLALREKAEPDAWATFNAKSMLGGCLLGQKKYADAEPLLLQGYEGMKQREAKIPPVAKPRLPEAIERLVQLYDAWGQREKAAQWRKELEAQTKAIHTKAEAAWHRAVERAGKDPVPWIQRGRWYAQRGAHDKAQADFAQAFKLDPDHPLCRLEREKQQRAKHDGKVSAVWDFSHGAAGWSAGSTGRLTAAGGILTMEGTGRDPLFIANVKAPSGRKVLTICARAPSAMNCQIFWRTKTAASFTEEMSVRFDMPGSDGKWREHRVSFEAESDLASLRFDLPDNGDGKLELAWMILTDDLTRKSSEKRDEK